VSTIADRSAPSPSEPVPLPPLERLGHVRWPQLDERDRAAVLRVLDHGVLSGPGTPEIVGLEADVAAYLGVRHCLAVNSGTAALHCALAAAGVRAGDEVIVPAFTFMASALAVAHQGATPVFCDVDPRTFNLDAARIAACVTERTRAIMAVHLHGLPADVDAIDAVAARHGLTVIEDAAQAAGASYRGRAVGTLARSAGFSLQMTKNLQGGDGGLFVTDDDAGALVARRLAAFGEDVPPQDRLGRVDWAHGIGWNYRIHQLSAAVARAQLPRLDQFNATARANARLLTDGLRDVPGLVPPYVPDGYVSSFHKYRVRLSRAALPPSAAVPRLRDRVVGELRTRGVHASLWQHAPIPAHPAFRRGLLRPWHADDTAGAGVRPRDDARWPVTAAILEDSFVLGSELAPLMVQPAAVMERYVDLVGDVLRSHPR
jgi:dTDP-4-amino-4,6-dideoxygalactose transaminase